jgi:signal transduction histidine kinase/CheY-like chemotaxis protein
MSGTGLTGILAPAMVNGEDEVTALRARVRQLEKINAALMDRVERSGDMEGGAFSMFETAIALESVVRDRTSALEAAMAELAAANEDATAARVLLRDAIESLDDGFALFDADDRLILCNRAFLKIFPAVEPIAGDSPEFAEMASRVALTGSTMGAAMGPDRWLSDRVDWHRRAEGAHVQALGDGRWIQINEIRTSDGGIVGIYTDITSVKAEDARQRALELAERNLALQATLDTLSEGVCLFDAQHRMQAWNEGLVRVLGLSGSDLLRHVESHAQLVQWCSWRLGLECADSLAWREGDTRQLSVDCLMDGRHFVIRSVPLGNGGMVFTFDDVTDHVSLQRSLTETAELLERRVEERTAELVEVNRQLVEAKNEAETANRSKTSFLAAASHDLLQPLNAARLFVSAMDGLKLPERPRALVSQASTALDSVEDLLEALFEISRLDAGAIQPEVADHSLGAILHALRVEFAPLATAGNLQFDVVETDAWVRSDARLLRRVLQNFVSNAIRYTEAGRVAVEVTEIQGMVRVTVRDTGPGIAASDREEIFGEFRRVGKTQKIPGKGLGLAIVRRVSTMLDHPIGLDSVPGLGSAFSIMLPRIEPGAAPKPVEQNSAVPTGNGGLVLVIDNDPAILSGMEALLENWGLEVVTARDPAESSVGAALARRPAMAIVDYQLDDGLTGEEAIATLRAQVDFDLPAMVITADRSAETKARLGAFSLPTLNKPVKPAQLRALLRQRDVL